MFDSILKSFTPDIPDNLSGRPRFVQTASIYFSIVFFVVNLFTQSLNLHFSLYPYSGEH